MILSSHYVIKDILHTVENGDAGEIRKICDKYCDRYRNDESLAAVCSLVSEEDSGRLSEKRLSEIRTRLQELLSVRRLDSSGGTNLWFVDRRKVK
ncbi:MAG: hypothetical protein WAX07_00025 [Candidatus Altiarchaeia archaeon]|jgi:hypothetical protein